VEAAPRRRRRRKTATRPWNQRHSWPEGSGGPDPSSGTIRWTPEICTNSMRKFVGVPRAPSAVEFSAPTAPRLSGPPATKTQLRTCLERPSPTRSGLLAQNARRVRNRSNDGNVDCLQNCRVNPTKRRPSPYRPSSPTLHLVDIAQRTDFNLAQQTDDRAKSHETTVGQGVDPIAPFKF
jgi:hypothetical protein